jgi:hypothetical protein
MDQVGAAADDQGMQGLGCGVSMELKGCERHVADAERGCMVVVAEATTAISQSCCRWLVHPHRTWQTTANTSRRETHFLFMVAGFTLAGGCCMCVGR